MSSSKRFLIVFALLGVNALFAMKDLSFATQAANLTEAIPASAQEIQALEGAIVAQAAMPQRESVVSPASQVSVQQYYSTKVSAYTSSVDQTDSTPFLTASGSYVRDGIAAANFLPFGTKFRIPKLFGDKVFVVEDRMNSRYNGTTHVDIFFEDGRDARIFGMQSAQLEVL
jgi:3D (Asp-Asp-Asp) domain-containing protein